jgi:hypothetical protein
MFRHRQLPDAGVAREHAYGLFAVAGQPFEDCPAGWVGEGLDEALR